MSIVKEKYSSQRINLLYQMLLNDKEQGHPRDYDIKVDELKVVQRTHDPERFFLHEEFVQPDTACITINVYDGSSRRCTKYQLYFGEVQMHAPTLSGVENTIQEKISNERRHWEYEQMKKEKEALEQKLGEAEEYAEGLEEKLETCQREFEELKLKRVGLAEMNAGRLLGFASDYLVKNQSTISRRLPFLSGLSGLLSSDEGSLDALAGTPSTKAPDSETGASFSRKTPDSSEQPDMATENKLTFFRQMEEAFSDPELQKVVEIIQGLAAQPQLLDTMHELVYSEINKKTA